MGRIWRTKSHSRYANSCRCADGTQNAHAGCRYDHACDLAFEVAIGIVLARVNDHKTGTCGEHARAMQLSSEHHHYFTSWMRLTMSACFGPYLSHTGLTASWKAFLSVSEISMIWMPAVLALSIACFSYSTHNLRSSCWASFENFISATCSSLDSVFQIFLEN